MMKTSSSDSASRARSRPVPMLLAGAAAAGLLRHSPTGFVVAPTRSKALKLHGLEPKQYQTSQAAFAENTRVRSTGLRVYSNLWGDGVRAAMLLSAGTARVYNLRASRRTIATRSKTAVTEAAALEREAALLRREAADLEAQQLEHHLLWQKKWFKAFDLDGSGTVDVNELMVGWKEVGGIVLDRDIASRLLELHDDNKNGVLDIAEFDITRFEESLSKLRDEDRETDMLAREEEKKTLAKLEAEQRLKDYEEKLPGNDDTGLPTRLLSVLAYLFPLVESVRYVLFFCMLAPALIPVGMQLVPPYQFLEAIPFGSLIVFFGMQLIASNTQLPSMLRFNLLQALQLDIALIVPHIFTALVDPASDAGYHGIANLMAAIAYWSYLPVAVALAYCLVSCLFGVAPRRIPLISEAAEKAMGVEKPEKDIGTDEH